MRKKPSLLKRFIAFLTPAEEALPGWLDPSTRFGPWGLPRAMHSLLTHRTLPLVVVVLAGFFALPTLAQGWGVDDDLLHRDILLSTSLPQATAQLFGFLDPQTTLARMDAGSLPWWTSSRASISFWRPLAVFSLWIDYQLWPNSVLLMRLHSIVWYLVLCACAAGFYRQFLSRRLSGGLAAILFAVSAPHFNAVAAVNARNVIQTSFFGLAAIYFHDHWRRKGWRPGAWLALVCLLGSLLSAEAGIATAGYLAAYALCLDRGAWRQRLASLLPAGLVVVLWRLVYQGLHYGAVGSAFYIDPVREPLRFALSLAGNLPVLLIGQWILPDPGLYALLSSDARLVYWLGAAAVLCALGMVLWPLLRRDATARFWAVGMLLALVPISAVNPATGRHLIFVSIGAVGLLAQFSAGLWEGRQSPLSSRRLWRLPAWLVSSFLLVLQGLVYPFLVIILSSTLINPLYTAMMDLGPLPGCEQQQVVVINAPSPGQFIYIQSLRHFRGQALPAQLRLLAPGRSAVSVARPDAHTLIVQPEYGYLLPPGQRLEAPRDLLPLAHPAFATQYGEVFFRSSAEPMPLGQPIILTGVQIQVTALTHDGRPLQIQATFDQPLEAASLRWLQWDWQQAMFVPFAVPAIGQSTLIPGPF